jgi:hypothetical protein
VPLFDTVLTSPRGYFVVCLPSRADETKVARFRTWLFDEVERDRVAMARLRTTLNNGENNDV